MQEKVIVNVMNKFTLQRLYYKDSYTIGKLYFNGEYICDTLEPPSAKLTSKDTVKKIKVAKSKGLRAIPSGQYQIVLTYSPRFKKRLPLLLNVPAFEGIRIHAGNTAKDTQGCILPGWNTRKGMVTSSLKAQTKSISLILSSIDKGEKVWIDIHG